MTVFTLTSVAISLISIFIARRIYWEVTVGSRRRAFAKQHGCLPAKSLQTPFTFGILELRHQLKAIGEHRLLPYLSKRYKEMPLRTIHYCVLGQEVFTTADPENVKTVLATNFSAWTLGQDRIKKMSSYLGYGIFVNEGAAWKHSREMLRPCFERSQIADVDMLERHIQKLLALAPKDGTTVDLQPLLQMFSMGVAMELLFGKSTNMLSHTADDDKVKAFCEAFDYLSNPFENESFKRWGMIALILPDWNRKDYVNVMQDFVDGVIEEHLRESEDKSDQKPRYTFLNALLASTPNRIAIRSELLNILLAGRDTVASLLSNILWELPRHPTVISKLRSEIENTIEGTQPTYDELKSMKYVRAIVNESQRLRPIVPINNREALVDTVLPRGGGEDGSKPVVIPKGATVTWDVYNMQRREDLFGEDAGTFRPERWLEPNFRPGWSYVPFSGGPRVCIGQNFAVTETMFVVVRLVREFDIEQRDFEEWSEKLGITCTGLGGCKVGLTPRMEFDERD